MADDFELLREHVERGSEEAFRALLERHARMVYGAALRLLGNPALAEEVSQAVFILLARKAPSLRRGTVVAGWLYRTTRLVALQALRAEQRRQQRHDQFAAMNDLPDSLWPRISPLLEEAMARLGASDRDALVLRFFEGRSFSEVADTLGTTEPAAKMRVSRAVEKLRVLMAREGVAVPAAALATSLAANTAPAAPDGLVTSISSALAGSAASPESLATLLKGVLKIMAWNKLRNAAIAVALVLLLGTTITLVVLKTANNKLAAPTVSTFEPMAGEWEGAFQMSGDGFAEPLKQQANLSIRALQGGRACQIEMRVFGADGIVAKIYRFTHSLNDAGDRIVTLDDPNIARPLGEGTVTTSAHDSRTGEWRAGFRAAIPNNGGSTDCQWVRRGDELIITRQDRTVTPQGTGQVVSELRLRRFGTTAQL